MEFLKKHFEKIVLSVVLLGLAGAAAYLPIKIKQNQAEIESAQSAPPPPGGVSSNKPVDVSKYKAAVAETHPPIALGRPHHLFNPVPWKRTPGGVVVKERLGTELGIGALKIVNLEPLKLTLTFDGVSPSGGDNRRYVIGMIREADPNKSNRRKVSKYMSVGSSNRGDPFVIRSITGPEDNPTGLEVEIIESKERVNVAKDKPFTRVEGYQSDLRYDPENKNFPDRRQMSQSSDAREYQVEFAGEKYNIVAITEKDVTVSAVSTSKRTTIAQKASK